MMENKAGLHHFASEGFKGLSRQQAITPRFAAYPLTLPALKEAGRFTVFNHSGTLGDVGVVPPSPHSLSCFV